jgi:hypothetical protein
MWWCLVVPLMVVLGLLTLAWVILALLPYVLIGLAVWLSYRIIRDYFRRL